MNWRVGCVVIAGLVAGSPAVWAESRPSYEAIYELHLTHASATTGPRAATGTYETRFAETCDGWDTRTHIVLDLAFRDGTNSSNERFFSSWESGDGLKYRFAVQTIKNGATVEAYKGSAALTKKGGQVTYEIPTLQGEKRHVREIKLQLPRDTLFPMAHSRRLLDRADLGEALYSSVVLSGSSSTGPRVMSTAIGPRLTAGKPVAGGDSVDGQIDPGLLGTPSWRMSSAFFNLNEKRDTPNTELFLQLYQTGVTQSFEQTFGDFTVGAKLSRLRRIDGPVCPKS